MQIQKQCKYLGLRFYLIQKVRCFFAGAAGTRTVSFHVTESQRMLLTLLTILPMPSVSRDIESSNDLCKRCSNSISLHPGGGVEGVAGGV